MHKEIRSDVQNLDGEVFGGDINDEYITAHNEKTIAALAKEFDVKPELIEAIVFAFSSFAERIAEKVHSDLSDIWKRLD